MPLRCTTKLDRNLSCKFWQGKIKLEKVEMRPVFIVYPMETLLSDSQVLRMFRLSDSHLEILISVFERTRLW